MPSRRSRSRSSSPRQSSSTTYPSKRGTSRSRSRSRDRRRDRERHHRDSRPRKQARDFSNLVRGDDKSTKYTWGKQEDEEKEEPKEPIEVEKPNFGLSGALAKDKATGNVVNGVVMKWTEPMDARIPTDRWRLYVFKKEKQIAVLHIHRHSAYLVGRDKNVADILVEHLSCSKQHAVIQFRNYVLESDGSGPTEHEIRPYIMDLKSTNHTYLNGEKVQDSRYVELKEKDVLKFGESTREYVLLKAT